MKFWIKLICFSFCILFVGDAFGLTRRYRLSLRDDPSTTMTIGWEQNGGSLPVLYFGTQDYGQNWDSYHNSQIEDRQVNAKGMDNRFVRLTGLTQNTIYYFVIKDSDGTSPRFWFKTTAMGNATPLSIIAGGDSRAYLDNSPRQNANKMVAKLRPDFVLFGGDYTWLGLALEWSDWMDDWQMTISSDGRMYPAVWERGNHEANPGVVYDLFDVPSADEYFSIPVGGTFLNIYTLNTEVSVAGNQSTWLESELQNNSDNFDWNIAQYHRTTRPHTTDKTNEDIQYDYWAHLFHDYGVQLIIESDAHDVKTTWPVKPSTGPNSDDGFEIDTLFGSVYIGEGCWGAPLRTNDWNRAWTRNSGSFNSFHWIKISKDTIEVRTIATDNVASVDEVTDVDRFTPPAGIEIWNPSNGNVVYIKNQRHIERPDVAVTYPFHLQYFTQPQAVTITADAFDNNGSVQNVKFFVNDVQIGQDNTFPYNLNWTIPGNGEYVITAWAIDNEGWHNISDDVKIFTGEIDITAQLAANDDDVEETKDNGDMDLTSSDLELCIEEWVWPIPNEDQWVGLRYSDLQIPQNAYIANAYIQFTSNENQTGTAAIKVYGENIDNASTFGGTNYNVSFRTRTNASVNWNPPSWNTDAAGAAEQTPNITSIVQEIVDRPGWESGNAMAFIFDGSGTRSAYSRDDDVSRSATLHITFQYDTPNSMTEDYPFEKEFLIFPNPSSDMLHINIKTAKETNLEIYSVSGQLINSRKLYQTENAINTDDLGVGKGIYLLHLYRNKKRFIHQIVIQ